MGSRKRTGALRTLADELRGLSGPNVEQQKYMAGVAAEVERTADELDQYHKLYDGLENALEAFRELDKPKGYW